MTIPARFRTHAHQLSSYNTFIFCVFSDRVEIDLLVISLTAKMSPIDTQVPVSPFVPLTKIRPFFMAFLTDFRDVKFVNCPIAPS